MKVIKTRYSPGGAVEGTGKVSVCKALSPGSNSSVSELNVPKRISELISRESSLER